MDLAERIRLITPSMTLAIDAKAKKLKRRRLRHSRLWLGASDLNTPQVISDAAKKAIDEGNDNIK